SRFRDGQQFAGEPADAMARPKSPGYARPYALPRDSLRREYRRRGDDRSRRRGCRVRTQRPPRERGAAGIVSAAVVWASLAWPDASQALTSLADTARDGQLAQVREQIAAGADVDAPHPDGTTPLLWAVHRGDLEMVEALIGAGASVDAANEFGVTPLLEASRAGDAAIIAALLAAGADVSRAHPTGETPLMAAARTGRVAAVRSLLEHGADPNARDTYQLQTA